MEMEPQEVLEATKPEEEKRAEERKSHLNATVAVTVAILAAFVGICKVKEGKIKQGMLQAQSDKIDNWGWYQAKKTRDELMREHLANLTIQAAAVPPTARATLGRELARVRKDLDDKKGETEEIQRKAEENEKDYERRDRRDDQFDLSDSALALTISLLAVTALTGKRFLFALALVPMAAGVLMGLAGLFGWPIYSDAVANWLAK